MLMWFIENTVSRTLRSFQNSNQFFVKIYGNYAARCLLFKENSYEFCTYKVSLNRSNQIFFKKLELYFSFDSSNEIFKSRLFFNQNLSQQNNQSLINAMRSVCSPYYVTDFIKDCCSLSGFSTRMKSDHLAYHLCYRKKL